MTARVERGMTVNFSFLSQESSELTAPTLSVGNTEVRKERTATRALGENDRVTLFEAWKTQLIFSRGNVMFWKRQLLHQANLG